MSTWTEDRAILSRAFRLFSGEKAAVAAVLVSTVVTTAIGVIPAFILRAIINDAIGHENMPLLFKLCAALITIPVFTGLMGVAQVYWMAHISQRVMATIRERLYNSMSMQGIGFFLTTPAGEIQSRLTNDVSAIEDVVVTTLRGTVVNITVVVSVIVSMFALSWALACVSLAIVPVFILVALRVGRAQKSNSMLKQQRLGALSQVSNEALSLGGVINTFIFGRGDYMRARFEMRSREVSQAGIRNQMVGRWFFMASSVLFGWAPALTYLVAGWAILRHVPLGVSIGTIVAFVSLQGRLFAPSGSLSQLLSAQVAVHGSVGVFERIFEYTDLPQTASERVRPAPLERGMTVSEDGLTCECVSFEHYAGLGQRANDDSRGRNIFAIRDLDLKVRRGEMVAVVGPSGAGKSTIAYLASGLLSPTKGRVLADSVLIEGAAPEVRSKLVGLAMQDAYLLNASVAENLLFGNYDAPMEAVAEVLRTVGMYERVMRLPRDLETVIGERGQILSSGERQRISLARLILQDPSVVILDEATNALDARTHAEILEVMRSTFASKATLTIAHQVWTVVDADRIVYVEDGSILEEGTHDQLLANHSRYSEFANLQLATRKDKRTLG